MLGLNNRKNSQPIGCGFMLGTGLVVMVLLILNALFVRVFFSINLSGLDDRVFQAAQFVLPIVMIFIEFWFYDLFTLRRRTQPKKPEDS